MREFAIPVACFWTAAFQLVTDKFEVLRYPALLAISKRSVKQKNVNNMAADKE
jgi:hypothetical protein